ncbi:antiviral RADAR system adenosine deaminase RdrB [Morganella morganii]|uniref:antiviral RADAR system adenosine deaminase RdrB n=1 Tax=Morganella morganii TaxID=582 RepID=UPI001BDA4377|nr:antiviral RADAR system adenosine deaminase RdrB [Morganella morganii]ELT0454969.1 hypothetical protein [Morganella morganii]MBT0338958.1 hypothetical protein [Morganella morganii subsp. morganii]
MLNIPLQWLVPSVLLGSDRLLNYAIDTPSPAVTNAEIRKQLYRLAMRDYQGYLSGKLRQEDIDLALCQWIDIEQSIDILPVLNKLRQQFIRWCGDRFEVENHQLESWLALLSQIDPAWIISAGYSESIDNGMLSVDQIISLIKTQCPNALPKRFDGEAVADNHVHLGGHGNNNLSMAAFALYLNKKPCEVTRERWPYREEHSLFNSGACDITALPVLFHRLFGLIIGEESNDSTNETYLAYDWRSLLTHKVTPHATTLNLFPANSPFLRLLRAATNENGPASWLLITTAILLLMRKEDSEHRKFLAKTFIQTASVLRNYMIVSGVGLGDFVKYFGFKYRKPFMGMDYRKHSQIYDLYDHHLREFRIAENSYKYFSSAARAFIEKKKDTHVHFVYHFTRGFNNKDESRRYTAARKNIAKQFKKLRIFLSSVTFDSYPIISEDFTKLQRVDLRAMLRGFDVAGNENELPIEVFSPALRLLRSASHHYKFPREKRLRQPFITLHAGEDYGHILSGLRAIDEAVTFCDYKPGDRIGHGLALGVDVDKWIERQQHIFLPLQEHLDNLVWCYQKGIELIADYPQFQPAVMVIREKIYHFCYELHGKEFSPQTLYQAWKLRRNCPLTIDKQSDALGTELIFLVPDLVQIQNADNESDTGTVSASYDLWLKYLERKRHDKDHEKVVSISYSQNIGRNSPNFQAGILEDSLSTGELELIHGIQDLMLEQFSQAQWVLEACPTSNVYIGRLKNYQEHPIFRWSPPKRDDLKPGKRANRFGIRRGPVKVCINTDDAGLMPTTLENEHRVIKECSIHCYGASDQDASLWINSIRRNGVEIFRSNHLDWVN